MKCFFHAADQPLQHYNQTPSFLDSNEIEVNSGRIFTESRRGWVNILPLLTEI